MHVRQLQDLVATFRDARDWRQFHKPKDLAMGIAAEAAELLEIFLWKTDEEVASLLEDAKGRERTADEMADVLAFLLSLADITGIDLDEALVRKIEKNSLKYPVGTSRGSAKKHNEE